MIALGNTGFWDLFRELSGLCSEFLEKLIGLMVMVVVRRSNSMGVRMNWTTVVQYAFQSLFLVSSFGGGGSTEISWNLMASCKQRKIQCRLLGSEERLNW